MGGKRIKAILIGALGEKVTARIHGIRFAYIIKKTPHPDPEVALIPRFIKKGGVAVDVGAANANWTAALHSIVGDSGRVLAFEADPYLALATMHTIRILRMKGVQLFQFGLSETEEEVPLRIVDDSNQRVSGLAYINKRAKTDHKEATMVRLKTLDSLIAEFPELLQTSVLKCDVEGYELYVLRGARQVLEKARPVVILEIGNYEKQGYTARDVYNFFRERNYSPFSMVFEGQLAPTDAFLHHDRASSVNRVLIPDEKIESVRSIVHGK
jgi:FkbM family methyltransferase